MMSQLFNPITIGPLKLPNRILVAPMCQYSAQNGCANEWHRVHIAGLALSGAGLVTIEATAPEPRGRITHNCLGLYSDETEAALTEVMRTVRAVSDTKMAIQIGHAGRKASSQRPWEGRSYLTDDEQRWQTVAPSAIPFFDRGPAPTEMDDSDLQTVRMAHVDAARRALRIGFDMLELHAGHGYLLSSFLSPLSNQRTDKYGGSLTNRLRYLVETVKSIRTVWPAERALSVKFNGTDWAKGGLTPTDAPLIAAALAQAGVDLVVISGGGVVQGPPPPVAPGYQATAAHLIKAEGIPVKVAVVGMIYDPHIAEGMLINGSADMVSVARAFLSDPRWGYRAAQTLGVNIAFPPQYDRSSPNAWPPARLCSWTQNAKKD